MARGKKTDNETLYKVMASYFITNNFSETARRLNMPVETVEDLIKRHIEDEEFTRLHQLTKEEFISKANRIIDKAMNRIEKELDHTDKIPLNQLATTLGILTDKKNIAEATGQTTETPNVQINIVNNEHLEEALYEEE